MSTPILCKCGSSLEKKTSGQNVVCCDECEQKLHSKDIVYQCKNGKTDHHPSGYISCKKCYAKAQKQTKSLANYQKLLQMGFDENKALEYALKYKNIEQCIDQLTKKRKQPLTGVNVPFTFRIGVQTFHKEVFVSGKVISCQCFGTFNGHNVNAAVLVNKVLWYAVRLIFYDDRKDDILVFKLCESTNANEIDGEIKKIKNYMRSPKPYKSLLIKFALKQQPPTEVIKIDAINPFYKLMAGDVVLAKRSHYIHYGVYIGNKKVVHWTGSNGAKIANKPGNIHETDWKEFAKDSTEIKAVYTPLNVSTLAERIETAKSYANANLLGNYNLVGNNCEHMSRLILYGIKHSTQVEDVAVGAGVAATGVALAFAILGAALAR